MSGFSKEIKYDPHKQKVKDLAWHTIYNFQGINCIFHKIKDS